VSQNNIVDLAEYRKEKFKNSLANAPAIMAFEPGHYYIYPELGVMAHCLFITDKSHTFINNFVYIMEDQYGNLVAEIMDDETCIGWYDLEAEVFIEAHQKCCIMPKSDPPDPPSPIAG